MAVDLKSALFPGLNQTSPGLVDSATSTPQVDKTSTSSTLQSAAVPEIPQAPPAFKADVPITMNSNVAAKSISEPATLPSITGSSESKIYQMNDGRFYNPTLGLSGATRESVLDVPQTSTGSSGGMTSAPSSEKGNTDKTPTPPTPNDDVTSAIKALFPQSDSLLKQYQDARTASGLPAQEAELTQVNKEIGDMQSVINNIENDVRTQAAGQADESFIQATVADRIRRLQPRIDQLNARSSSLNANINSAKENITTQLGFSQQDIQNAASDRTAVRQGIKDLLDTYGSVAFSNVDPAVLSEIERRAGLPQGSINAQTKTLSEQKQNGSNISFQEYNGHIYKLNSSSGDVVDTGIVIPPEQKDETAQAIQIAQLLQNSADPDSALRFLQNFAPQSIPGANSDSNGGNFATGATIGSLSDDSLSTLLSAMAKREGYGADASNRPTRNNNPGNIKVPSGGISVARERYGDPNATIDPVAATDGGQFIKFSNPEAGFRAMGTLLKSGVYSGLSVDAALKKWSNNGYGSEIVGSSPVSASGLKKKNTMIGSYSDDQFKALNIINDNIRQNPTIQNFDQVKNAYQQVLNGAQQNNGIGDNQLITAFAKMNDPQTGVRTEEAKSVEDRISIVNRLLVLPKKILQGDQLSSEARSAFIKATQDLYDKKLSAYNEASGVFKKQASKAGLDGTDLNFPIIPEQTSKFSIAVGGKTYVFPSQEKLDAFKVQAGIK